MEKKAAFIAACMLVLFVFVYSNHDVSEYVAGLKYNGATLQAGSAPGDREADELLATIRAEAEKRRIAPVDAVIDRVWKAIPGYNGLEVDIERTLSATLEESGSSEIKYIYNEVKPKVMLEDLGPYPIYRGNPNKPMIGLMINVAWGNEYLESILSTLEAEKVKATFFLDGSWLNKYPDIAKQIAAAGHELSNHAYTHPDMKALSREQAYQQIARTEALLKNTLKVDNKWFAPPSGSFNQATVQIAREQGLKTVLWTIDTIDWQKPSVDTVLRRVTPKLEPGALILMHPTAATAGALSGIIHAAKTKGYTPGSISETLSSDRVPAFVEGK